MTDRARADRLVCDWVDGLQGRVEWTPINAEALRERLEAAFREVREEERRALAWPSPPATAPPGGER